MGDFAEALEQSILEPIFNQEGVLLWRELEHDPLHPDNAEMQALKLRALLKHLGQHDFIYLLESTLQSPDRARYSFLAVNPLFTFDSFLVGPNDKGAPFNSRITLHQTAEAGQIELETIGDPLNILQFLINAQQRLANQLQQPPFPFCCGLIGYFGYELLHAVEELPILDKDQSSVPDMSLSFVTAVVVQDRLINKTFGVALGLGGDSVAARSDAEAQLAEIDRLWQRMIEAPEISQSDRPSVLGKSALQLIGEPLNSQKAQLSPHSTKEQYLESISTIKQHLAAGDAYEVCLTHKFKITDPPAPVEQEDLIDLYLTLSELSPVPFAAFMQTPEVSVISASPERFLRVLADRTVESSPIKGTRKRSDSIYQDQQLKADLALNEKDRAEHLMIVDLVRNDLGRHCEFGSVTVADLMRIETYSTVHQLISTIRGKLREEAQFTDLFRALFPPGSMTGAPKVEAMRIIGELESVKRGVYSGALGYLDLFGGADLSVVIRTAVFEALTGQGSLHVGGAIVTDSDPEGEYAETVVKTVAMERALAAVRNRQVKTTCEELKSEHDQRYSELPEIPTPLSSISSRATYSKNLRPILLIDNYDSFTFNIYQYLGELGYLVLVARNDQINLSDIAKLKPAGVIISPGPGAPDEPEAVGICPSVIESLAGDVPILGVCLGLQILVTEFGGRVISAPEPRHGKLSEVKHNGHKMFDHVPHNFTVMRYHSLIAAEQELPECFQITARSRDDGLIMAIAHEELPITAVQFHPESIGSSYGRTILRNFCQQIY